MAKYGGVTIAKQPRKGSPRNPEEARNLPKSATRNPYTNPSVAKTPFNGTVNEKL